MSLRKGATAIAAQALHQAKISIPATVEVLKQADELIFSGPLGTTRTALRRIDSEGVAALKLLPEERSLAICSSSKAFFGTLQSTLENKLHGVTRGFLVYLRIVGIGYRASLSEQTLSFKLGFSHDVTYTLPPALRAFLPEPTLLGLYGLDKNQVTQAAAKIIALKPPSVYKGKGIRLADTTPRTKVGKKK